MPTRDIIQLEVMIILVGLIITGIVLIVLSFIALGRWILGVETMTPEKLKELQYRNKIPQRLEGFVSTQGTPRAQIHADNRQPAERT